MKASQLLVSCLVFLSVTLVSPALAKKVPGTRPFQDGALAPTTTVTPQQRETLAPDLRHLVPPAPMLPPADTFHLAWFDWETAGAPDPQGWITVDRTAQLDTFFHVADATELDGGIFGGLVPLEGTQSLWCGVDESDAVPYCGWATLPGYGNNWNQLFCSRTLECDSLRFYYKVRWDSEPGYDETVFQYWDESAGDWVSLPVNGGYGLYDGAGEAVECLAFGVPDDSTKLRFRFTSDGAFSSEDGLYAFDGAVLVDSITVECYVGGVLDATYFEDFEDEAHGARVTDDGVWMAKTPEPFGDFAMLYPGTSVLQDEDPCTFVLDYVWGFFDDPLITNFACGGHPEQGAIRYGPNAEGLYLDNQIWSPLIPMVGVGDEVTLSFLMYDDLPLDPLIFYTYEVRSFINGCPAGWKTNQLCCFPTARAWRTFRVQLGSLIDPAADEIQIALGAIDMCPFWCLVFGTGTCHGHAPLFSDVHVVRVNQTAPTFTIRHIDLFQDNFAADGTTTGTARADMAADILPSNNPGILPGDSACVTVDGGPNGIATDPLSGAGPSVYTYVAVWPQGQANKSGADIEAPETRAAVGARYPFVDTVVHDGVTWFCFRADSALASDGDAIQDRYCIDLNDQVFTPGDTICYFFCATDGVGNSTYFSRWLDGQSDNFMTDNLWEAAASPMEFQVLPGGAWPRGGSTLYVDDADDRGGPVQLYFDTAFELLGVKEYIDRYDVLGPSSAAGNSLASRVVDPFQQILGCYDQILWSSGNLSTGTIGDGTGNPEKSDDYALINLLLDQYPNFQPGFYFTGDDIHEELTTLSGASAITFRSLWYQYTLVDGSHINNGAQTSPCVLGLIYPFIHLGVPDSLIAYGGCPLINDFDVVAPAGGSTPALVDGLGNVYALMQYTPNSAGTIAVVMGSGFSFHYIHSKDASFPPARVHHMQDILIAVGHTHSGPPVGIGDTPLANALGNNYPNPFNPVTTITYSTKEHGHVSLKVYNVAGQLVRTLVDEEQAPSVEGFAVTWDGRSDTGQAVSSGVYFYKLTTKDFSQTRKMVLLK